MKGESIRPKIRYKRSGEQCPIALSEASVTFPRQPGQTLRYENQNCHWRRDRAFTCRLDVATASSAEAHRVSTGDRFC